MIKLKVALEYTPETKIKSSGKQLFEKNQEVNPGKGKSWKKIATIFLK